MPASSTCSLLRLACADLQHALARPCRRGRGRSVPLRGLRRLLCRCFTLLLAAILVTLLLLLRLDPAAEKGTVAAWVLGPQQEVPGDSASDGAQEASHDAEAEPGIELQESSNSAAQNADPGAGSGERSSMPPETTPQSAVSTRPRAVALKTNMPAAGASGTKLPSRRGEADVPKTSDPSKSVHICFCSDDKDLRPLVVAINSTLASAKQPRQIMFHLITSSEQAPIFAKALQAVLPPLAEHGQLLVHHDDSLHSRIKSLVTFRSTSGARKSLASPFNFAPFYLEAFLAGSDSKAKSVPARLIYMDTDVVLEGDVQGLQGLDLQDMPAAAVQDCSQAFELYIDFKEMKKLGFAKQGLDPKDCVFNRGVFVVDINRWKALRITEEIETWMGRYRDAKKDLYKFGLSQPPWLLALHGRYRHLGPEWNCRGLGREFLNEQELVELKEKLGVDFKALRKLGARAAGKQMRPFVAPCAEKAKLLHFNGALKPWRQEKWERKQLPPLCAVSSSSSAAAGGAGSLRQVNGHAFVTCADRWSRFLSASAASYLKTVRGGAKSSPAGS